MTAEVDAPGVALPEIAVPPDVLVVSLTTGRGAAGPPEGSRVPALVQEWLAVSPGLQRHDRALAELLEIAAGPGRLGEVAAFLAYRDVDHQLVGGVAVLSLELLEPLAGTPAERAAAMAAHLRRTAGRLGHVDGLSQVGLRRTVSGVEAARVRFLAALPSGPGRSDSAGAPLVEVCRWLYPVPGHDDLVWALAFQTTDLEQADDLVAEFDQQAASLTWVDPGDRGDRGNRGDRGDRGDRRGRRA